ncbi:flagellar motor switch protein FliG [Diplocloster agilis]|uniref:flagellar motor switch protein FliG n=1 Tax=Diplocloster agilis TaxID=2850323 RepID=UPI0008215375|nr:flagellar motor switch protein FliG [Suonthocola fibrivorans]MCU6734537.1 flagellar motor switch protein FliG [Suonthocola fibrivorans]SCJ43969.1 Flagellar motor switch protein FliG [uncultured Clostridium sp.]
MNANERNPAEKAAAVISMLGADSASQVFHYLSENEIEQISVELSRLPRLEQGELENIANEFYDCCVTEKVITEGGREYAKEVLERAFGQQQAKSLMERVSKAMKTKAFSFIRKIDYKTLMTIIQNEHPQTLALILSYATPEQASKIVANLPKETRIDVVERIANMDRAVPSIIKIVENVVQKKIGSSTSEETTEVGGLNYVADVMNHVDRSTERDIFEELNIKNPQLAEDVRKLMFVFEDIAYLDPLSIQRFIRDTDTKDIAVALKVANKDVANAIFSNMSTRMRETIQSDMEYLRNIRMSDVEDAQQRIVGTIRRLKEEGEIVISKDGKDEIIV